MSQINYLKIFTAAFLAITFFLSSVIGPAPVAYAQDDEPPTPQAEDAVNEEGTSDPDVNGQIVGGVQAGDEDAPWQVALIGSSSDDEFYFGSGFQFCGGTLIDPYWVLTAAHCVETQNGGVPSPSSIDIVAGVKNLASPLGGFQRRDVVKIVRHPSYNKGGYLNNDVALLKLASPVTIGGSGPTKTATIPIATPTMGNWTGKNALVTGWGNTKFLSPPYPYALRKATVKVISNTECAATYGDAITGNMLCTKFVSKKSVCSGDSGGPLAIDRNGAGNWVLVGVVSFSNQGCSAASGYARVSKYTSWINGHILEPSVKSITRLDASPTKAGSIRFKVVFTKSVSGVDASDFDLTGTATAGAIITGVTGTGKTRTVTVSTGANNGTLRLNVLDDDSIKDSNLTPLGGVGAGNGSVSNGPEYVIAKNTTTVTYYSRSIQDGWVLESSETSNKGGITNSSATTLRVGDDAKNKQYRSILDFYTSDAPIDPSALFFKVTLRMKRQGITGSNPFSALGAIQVDFKTYFGPADSLEKVDFQASPAKKNITNLTSKNSNGWYSAVIGSANYGFINRNGSNQFRLRFATDDNNNSLANFISFHSGNATNPANHPQLIIEYYTLP
jgi:secreted trypsin-like serine protease